MKNVKTSTILLIGMCIAIWGLFIGYFILNQKEPKGKLTLTLQGTKFEMYQNSDIDYMMYVKVATDEKGNDLNDSEHIEHTRIDVTTTGLKTIEYTLTDDRGNSITKSLLMRVKEYPGASNISSEETELMTDEELESILNGEE